MRLLRNIDSWVGSHSTEGSYKAFLSHKPLSFTLLEGRTKSRCSLKAIRGEWKDKSTGMNHTIGLALVNQIRRTKSQSNKKDKERLVETA